MSNQVAVKERNITDTVLARVQELENSNQLHFPQNYSYQNALKSAWLILQETKDRNNKPALDVCTKESVANSLFNMVIQGLSPAKKQCYFIVYGNQLQLSRSYFGTIAVTKRLKGVKDVFAEVIYEGDDFAYEINLDTGRKQIIRHAQSFENIDNTKIKGAYAIVLLEDDTRVVEVMNMKQIKASWAQGPTKGNSGAHQNFAEEMAKKSVINRACKPYINTSDDSDLLIEAINDDDRAPMAEQDQINYEILEDANQETLDIEAPAEVPVVDDNRAVKPAVVKDETIQAAAQSDDDDLPDFLRSK